MWVNVEGLLGWDYEVGLMVLEWAGCCELVKVFFYYFFLGQICCLFMLLWWDGQENLQLGPWGLSCGSASGGHLTAVSF